MSKRDDHEKWRAEAEACERKRRGKLPWDATCIDGKVIITDANGVIMAALEDGDEAQLLDRAEIICMAIKDFTTVY